MTGILARFACFLAALLALECASAPAAAQNGPDPGYAPVVVPNGATLPFKQVNGVKVFHLVAEPVKHEFAPGLKADCWGYNGRTPGPVIEAVEGDRIRIYVSNRLPEPTSLHCHGILLPNGMDGVSGLTQKSIAPGETFVYEFTLIQHGTFMYHPHFDEMTQIGLGMSGMIVVHPREPETPRVDRDFALMVGEWKIPAGASRPDPSEMTEFNILTINSKCFPGTAPLVVKQGDRVRIRIGNLSAMDHHPIHLHGYHFKITATDGGDISREAQWGETTVLVPVGSTRDIQFVADAPGDWAMHCHMTHHLMNQMGHGLPNLVGIPDDHFQPFEETMRRLIPGYMTMGNKGMGGMGDMGMRVPSNSIPMSGGPGPYGYIDMGGMFTVVKVRENLESDKDPGWYTPPANTVARPASANELKRDGIAPPAPSEP